MLKRFGDGNEQKSRNDDFILATTPTEKTALSSGRIAEMVHAK